MGQIQPTACVLLKGLKKKKKKEYDKLHVTHKTYDIYYLALYRQSLLPLGIHQ